MRRHTRPRRLALAAAVLTIAGGAHPARSVDTSGSPPNRTSFATATVVNPATGEITAIPPSFTDTNAPDRTAFATATTVDPVTGQVTATPSSFRTPLHRTLPTRLLF